MNDQIVKIGNSREIVTDGKQPDLVKVLQQKGGLENLLKIPPTYLPDEIREEIAKAVARQIASDLQKNLEPGKELTGKNLKEVEFLPPEVVLFLRKKLSRMLQKLNRQIAANRDDAEDEDFNVEAANQKIQEIIEKCVNKILNEIHLVFLVQQNFDRVKEILEIVELFKKLETFGNDKSGKVFKLMNKFYGEGKIPENVSSLLEEYFGED